MRWSARGVLAVAGCLLAGAVRAADLSFAGTFTRDDAVGVFSFEVAVNSEVTIETFGYAGGVDPLGHVVSAGGFDPVLALFTADGGLLAVADDGATRVDPATGAAFDARVDRMLAPGSYYVALSQYDNFPVGPNFYDGFTEGGNPNFTSAFGCAAGRFCDVNGHSRNRTFEFALSVSPVPEPAPATLLALGLLPLAWRMRQRAARRLSSTTGDKR